MTARPAPRAYDGRLLDPDDPGSRDAPPRAPAVLDGLIRIMAAEPAEGWLMTCQFCEAQWIGWTRDYCPGCGLDHNGQPGTRRP